MEERKTDPSEITRNAWENRQPRIEHKIDPHKYKRFMLRHIIPQRFAMILLPEVLISIFLFVGVKLKFIIPVYEAAHIIALLLYWALIWRFSMISREFSENEKYHYICNLSAFALFLLIASAAFILARNSPDYPIDALYYPLFRLSLSFALLTGRFIEAHEVPMSITIFYSVTLVIILLEPLVPKLLFRMGRFEYIVDRKLDERERERYLKKKQQIQQQIQQQQQEQQNNS